ncbi:cytochrome-c peroxidase [Hydrogenothermus marinus]|uniref:Cytochrome c peroxidase n=1 Tax=Hydrogenothermus marinus TaxID=133270 RepID=A0A3M0BN22_9AQUI|nr:cytochrome-c peroxidase [Hydrogenothermus marinus]RMA97926.1 cytochrome c peroxidase [Hydrogenothermus marinus]
MKSFIKALIIVLTAFHFIYAKEPIKPIPQKIDYNKEKAELGKMLFFDKNLSSDKTISCASCHDPNHGGADPRPVSTGVKGRKGYANAPTVFNSYFNFRQFWNGRAKDLKEQANGPIHNPIEMNMNKEKIEKYLRSNEFYRKMFKKVYGRKPTYEDALDAIVEFEKALITPNSKFDRYLRGEVKLSPLELKGYKLFKTLGCITCHNGINIGGNSFQKMGVIYPYVRKEKTPDRYAITYKEEDKMVFKVPSLRNIALTAPYFHDGSAKTLEEALIKMAYHNLGFTLTEEEIKALVAFLKTLTGEKPEILRK